MTDNILECRGITKKFGDFTALDNVSISIPKGKIFGLLGPNGAGKTTLIRIINQITVPTEGEVIYKGIVMDREAVRTLGYLPEERGLYKKMKVGEQALYMAKLRGLSTAEATARLKEWFVKFKIQSWWNMKVEDLSKGMAQKVQFIVSVLHKPDFIILDEPFSGFDPVNAQLIRDEILKMRDEGCTIVLSTHNMESVEELCDNIALINRSKLVVTGSTDDIREQYGDNQLECIFSGNLNAEGTTYTIVEEQSYKGGKRALLHINEPYTTNDVIAQLIESNTIQIDAIRRVVPRMNDIFIKLVG